MPSISKRGIEVPASPIRKLTPFADAAKAFEDFHQNAGSMLKVMIQF